MPADDILLFGPSGAPIRRWGTLGFVAPSARKEDATEPICDVVGFMIELEDGLGRRGWRHYPKMMITTWYDEIEEPIRPAVRLLRDNGFNTTCSCGHEMYIEVDLGNTLDEAERLANLLADNDYTDFKITSTLQVPSDGFWSRRAVVQLETWV